jgi:hypothetical protein
MGILVSKTSKDKNRHPLPPIPRVKIRKVADIIKGKGIPILPYLLPSKSGLSSVYFEPMVSLQSAYVMPKDTNLDLMWHAARFLRDPRPSWTSFMSKVCVGDYPGKSDTYMLPIMDMDPNNLSCIFSTLDSRWYL